MYSKPENFFIAFLKQMVCLKFLIVYYLVFILVWSPVKILVHYLDFPLSLNSLLFFYAIFCVVWTSSLALDCVTRVLVSAIYHPIVVKYLRFCDVLIAGFVRAYPKFTVVCIKKHISFTLFFFAHSIGLTDTPLIVEFYFATYSFRTLFVAPLISITAIQNHELFGQLASRYYMLGAEKAAAQQVSKAVVELLENPNARKAFTGSIITGTVITGAAEIYQHAVVSGINAREEQLEQERIKTPLMTASESLRKEAYESRVEFLDNASDAKASLGLTFAARSAIQAIKGESTLDDNCEKAAKELHRHYVRVQLGLDNPATAPAEAVPVATNLASVLEKLFF